MINLKKLKYLKNENMLLKKNRYYYFLKYC